MTELNKLAVMLARAGIPFEIKAFNIDKKATWRIVYPCAALAKLSAASHKNLCGGDKELIEILRVQSNETIGCLSAKAAFEYFNGGNEQ